MTAMRVLLAALVGMLAGYAASRYVIRPVDKIQFHPSFRKPYHHFCEAECDCED